MKTIGETLKMNDLEAMRKETGLTQAQFAEKMGVPLRTYEDILAKKRVRPVHLNAARWAVIASKIVDKLWMPT